MILLTDFPRSQPPTFWRDRRCACARRGSLIVEISLPVCGNRARDAVCLTGACIEFVGIMARAVGPSFVKHPQMLPSVLTPLLEKLGDPDREVMTCLLQDCICALQINLLP